MDTLTPNITKNEAIDACIHRLMVEHSLHGGRMPAVCIGCGSTVSCKLDDTPETPCDCGRAKVTLSQLFGYPF